MYPNQKEVTYDEVKTIVLEGGRALSILHVGSYNTLYDSYKVMADYIKDNNIKTNALNKRALFKRTWHAFKRQFK